MRVQRHAGRRQLQRPAWVQHNSAEQGAQARDAMEESQEAADLLLNSRNLPLDSRHFALNDSCRVLLDSRQVPLNSCCRVLLDSRHFILNSC